MNADAVSEQPRTRTTIAGIRKAQQDSLLVRWGLTLAALGVVGVLVVIPVVNVFSVALSEGLGVYWKNLFADEDTLHAIKLTLTVAPIAVAGNLIFGVAAAWAIARFDFPEQSQSSLTAALRTQH